VCASTVPDPADYGEYEVADPDRGVTKACWFALDALPSEDLWAWDHGEIVRTYQADPTTYPMSIFMSGPQAG